MTIYVVLMFLSILVGMAISVKAFGTGGKRAKVFEDIYFSVEDVEGIGIVYTKSGDYSALMEIENPVQKYSADTDSYYDYQQLFTKICQSLGEGYILQKQDVFIRKRFDSSPLINGQLISTLELFVSSSPGNCSRLNADYDRFLTLSDAALCLMYKESQQHGELTPLKFWYTDRQCVAADRQDCL